MTFEVIYDHTPNGVSVDLSGELTAEYAGELKAKLMLVLAEDRDIRLNLSGVTRLDITFAQIICALDRSMRRRSRSITINADPDGMTAYGAPATAPLFAADCPGSHDDNSDCIWTRLRQVLDGEVTHAERG